LAYKLFLKSISAQNAASVRDELQKIFGIGQGQASDIVNAAPIVLLDDIPDLDSANRILEKFQTAIDAGAEIIVTDEPLEHTAKLRWSELPQFVGKGANEQRAEGEVLNLAKYNFVVDEREIFRCPSCGEMFLIKHLSPKEKEAALRQAQIEEAEPLEEQMPQTGVKIPEREELDLASFEEGLAALEHDQGAAPSPAPTPGQLVGPTSESGQEAQEFFHELESLPTEKPQEGASAVEEELEELAPEEAGKFFKQRIKGKPTGQPVPLAQPHKVRLAPQPRRRFGRGLKGEAGRARPAERPDAAPEPVSPEVEHSEGYYGVFISQLTTTDKREKAARLIVEMTGMPYPEARSLCDGMIVNVLREVSEEEAQDTCQKFKEAGIAAKVTVQKRKKRYSERMRKRDT
jgi:ribosomal protein L7/L12